MHMKDKISTYVNDIKKLFNKDITEQVRKYRIPLIGGVVVILLACISIFVTYAFYQVEAVTPIVGGSTGDIADIELRVMVEDRNTDDINSENYGTAKDGQYILYPYIPEAGYEYNEAKSYCTNGSTINYNSDTFDVEITAYGHDVCYMYFDSTANLDITLRVWAENVDTTTGEGTGKYTKLETTTMPSIGYELNSEKTTCTPNATVSYIAENNMFSVAASGKAECDVYMDALNVDIALKIFLQAKSGSQTYYEADSIPSNYYYDINSEKSSCTGTSTLSIENQRVIVAATSRTSCVAYLDVSSGPILESMNITNNGTQATVSLTNSNIGTSPTMYYFSNDNGKTYVSSSSPSYTFNVENGKMYQFAAYSTDASGKTSSILKTEDFIFNGLYEYSNKIQDLNIPKTGYYLLEVWGAQGGGATNSSTQTGGYGGYSKGIVQLTEGDTLYIVTGGQGTNGTSTNIQTGGYNGGGAGRYHGGSGGGATHIATQSGLLSTLENNKDAILIVAGGGGGGASTNGSNCSDGGHGGGFEGVSAYNNCADTISSNGYGTGGTQLSGGGPTANGSSNLGYGQIGTFGAGATSTLNTSSYGSGGGGGGYYGGGTSVIAGAGGGSGYIGNPLLISSSEITKSMYCYNCPTSTSKDTLTYSVTSVSSNAISGSAKQGNGYAKITYIGTELP